MVTLCTKDTYWINNLVPTKKKNTTKLIKPGRKNSVLSLVSSRTMEIRAGKKFFRPPIPYLGQCGGVFPADSRPLSPAYCRIITGNNVTSCFPRSKLPHPSHIHELVGLPGQPYLASNASAVLISSNDVASACAARNISHLRLLTTFSTEVKLSDLFCPILPP